LRGDPHQVEQDPGADLRRQRRTGCGVEAEEHRLTSVNGIFQYESRSKVLPGGSFDDESEARPESGHTFAFELAESVDETAQSSRLRRAELAQQRDELVGFEQV